MANDVEAEQSKKLELLAAAAAEGLVLNVTLTDQSTVAEIAGAINDARNVAPADEAVQGDVPGVNVEGDQSVEASEVESVEPQPEGTPVEEAPETVEEVSEVVPDQAVVTESTDCPNPSCEDKSQFDGKDCAKCGFSATAIVNPFSF